MSVNTDIIGKETVFFKVSYTMGTVDSNSFVIEAKCNTPTHTPSVSDSSHLVPNVPAASATLVTSASSYFVA